MELCTGNSVSCVEVDGGGDVVVDLSFKGLLGSWAACSCAVVQKERGVPK